MFGNDCKDGYSVVAMQMDVDEATVESCQLR